MNFRFWGKLIFQLSNKWRQAHELYIFSWVTCQQKYTVYNKISIFVSHLSQQGQTLWKWMRTFVSQSLQFIITMFLSPSLIFQLVKYISVRESTGQNKLIVDRLQSNVNQKFWLWRCKIPMNSTYCLIYWFYHLHLHTTTKILTAYTFDWTLITSSFLISH